MLLSSFFVVAFVEIPFPLSKTNFGRVLENLNSFSILLRHVLVNSAETKKNVYVNIINT